MIFENALLKLYQALPERSRLKHNPYFEIKINRILQSKIDKERHNVIKLRWEKEKLQKILDDLRSADGQK